MSVVTRTNRAINPQAGTNATNYAAVAGTGGTASGARNTGVNPVTNVAGFYRVSWTAATTAVSGGATYTQTGLSASTQYSFQAYVLSSKAQTVRLTAQYQNSSSVNVGSLAVSAGVALTAGVYSQVKLEGVTSGAAVDRVVLTVEATTGGALWASGDTLDVLLVQIETGAAATPAFTGDYAAASSIVYSWAGTAHASNSSAVTYTPVLAVAGKTDAPTDRIEITITDMVPQESTYTLWRTVAGLRRAVRGYRSVKFTTSDVALDYEAPIGRALTYQLEAEGGPAAGMAASTGTGQVGTATQAYGWVQDPLDPASAVKVYGDITSTGDVALMDESIKQLEYSAEMNIIQILGSSEPVALIGQRMAAAGVPFRMATEAAQAATNLRNLIFQAPLLLIRPVPAWSSALPGACYTAAPSITELPINEAWGGNLIEWRFNGQVVAAPSMNVLIPLWTYGDVAALWTTYQQAQSALGGKTYLAVKKNPATGL